MKQSHKQIRLYTWPTRGFVFLGVSFAFPDVIVLEKSWEDGHLDLLEREGLSVFGLEAEVNHWRGVIGGALHVMKDRLAGEAP